MRIRCAILSLVLLLSGCSLLSDQDVAPANGDPTGDLAFGDDPQSEDSTADAPPETVPRELRDRGGVLRVGVAATTWDDPALIDEAREGEQQVADLLFDGLTSVEAGGELRPAVASSWSPNSDASEWTFVIDPAAEFSDGSTITPEDVTHSLERVAALGVESLAANRLSEVTAIDAFDDSVVVKLDRPFAGLPRLLASPIFGIVPVGFGNGSGLPVTSGSLAVVSEENNVIELASVDAEANFVDGIELHLYGTDSEVADAFANGLLDLGSTIAKAGTAEETGSDNASPIDERRVVNGLDTSFFLMNLGNEAFADPQIRQALVLAVDGSFVASGTGLMAMPLEGLLPSSSDAWRPGVCEDCPYQPDQALEILGGYSAGSLPLIHVDHLDDPESTAIAEAVVSDLAYVGFDVQARPHTPQAFAAKAAAGELSLFQFGVVGSWSSPEAYLGSLFATDGADNVTSFSDPEVDRLLDEASQTLDDADRRLLYQQAEARILAFSVVIPLFEREHVWLIGPNVRNVRPAALGSFDPTAVWIAAE